MTADSLRIVEATTPEEISAVAELFADYATSMGWDEDSGGWLADEIAALPGPYASPRGALLLATYDAEPAGALGLQPVPSTALIEGVDAEKAGELKRLFVRTEYRQRGIGRALMERAEIEARARGYDALVLTTSTEWMPLAQRVYDSLSYIGTQPYRNDMPWPQIRWMRKEL